MMYRCIRKNPSVICVRLILQVLLIAIKTIVTISKLILLEKGWLVIQHVTPCWVILYGSQFNNYGFQLYTV